MQILRYGRFVIGGCFKLTSRILARSSSMDGAQNAILRYGRLKICATGWRARHGIAAVAMALCLALSGCRKDASQEASDSDANGYLCQKCEAKLYTARSVFIGPKCPKCQEDTLVEVVGYVCPKDNHLTIRGRSNDRLGAPVCESCQGPLGGMRLPREKDLKAWGATKVSS